MLLSSLSFSLSHSCVMRMRPRTLETEEHRQVLIEDGPISSETLELRASQEPNEPLGHRWCNFQTHPTVLYIVSGLVRSNSDA